MALKNEEYWRRRFVLLENSLMKRNVEYYTGIESVYKQTYERMGDDINRWYRRFATNNEISLDEAKKLLREGELREFKFTIEEYIKAAKENTIDGRWEKQLDNILARVNISRLESLQIQLQQHAELLYGAELLGFQRLIKEQYTEQYNRTIFEVQKGFNIGFSFQKLDDRKLTKIISKPWTADGLTFSNRIIRDRNVLVDAVFTELTQGAALGQGPEPIVKAIQKKLGLDNKVYEIRRLVVTESTFFSSAAQKDAFNELGLERYEYLATLDGKTSDICQTFDGKVFAMKDYEPGVTAPPLHVFCRSTTIPYFEDDTESQRFARDKDGNGIYIPANIKYDEWLESFGE